MVMRGWLSALCFAALAVASAYGREMVFGGAGGGFEKEPLSSTLLRLTAAASAAALAGQLAFGGKVGSDATEGDALGGDGEIWREELGVSKKVPADEGRKKLPAGAKAKLLTLKEVSTHNTIDDCWIVVNEQAFDVTKFIKRHPGGIGPIENMAGKDCTDVFDNYHSARVYKTMLPAYYVGEVTDVVVWPHVEDFRKARQELLRRGLFETDYRFYARLGAWLATLFFGSLYLSLGCESYSAHMWGAVAMGVFWQQLAGVGHDLGHSGVTHNFHLDHKIGSVLTSLMGLSVCWWKSDHNTHHIVCNAVEHDPNIQHMPLLGVSPNIFKKPFWDTYHKKQVGMNAVARFLVSYQHFLFYPVMAVARINLYLQGLIFLLSKPDTMHYQKTELCSLAVFATWLTYVVCSLPAGEALTWVLLSHAVAGVLHVQIVLSHWSMEIYNGRAYTGKDDEWYITQLKTTMNVATPEWLDFVHIGLQFQIEHHLFPRLPRHSLREARKLTQAICKKHNFHYHEPGFFEGNVEMWRTLRDSAMAARETSWDPETKFYQSAIWEGLNLAG